MKIHLPSSIIFANSGACHNTFVCQHQACVEINHPTVVDDGMAIHWIYLCITDNVERNTRMKRRSILFCLQCSEERGNAYIQYEVAYKSIDSVAY